jgi:hypothetical protein
MRALLFPLLVLSVAGCSGSSSRAPTSPDGTAVHRPAAYHPEQFPDIPFERLVGYRLTAEDPQVAFAIAGGALRRLSLVFITRPGDEPKPANEELDRLIGGLTGLGWTKIAAAPTAAAGEVRCAKDDEILVIRASTDSSATTIEFHLEPAAAPAGPQKKS